jgi:peptide/nickel transport system permease protein
MFQYLLKRVLLMVPTLLGITLITFVIINLAPGDPVATSMGGGGLSASESGGRAGQEGAALVIRAKKQLLGILSKDPAVRAWGADAVSLPHDPKSTRFAPIVLEGRLGSFDDWPTALLPTEDGRSLFVGTGSGALVLLDSSTGEVRVAYAGHTKSVDALAVAPDGTRLASGDVDGGLALWSVADGRRLAAESPSTKPIRELAYVDSGRSLVSGADDGVLRLHDPSTGRVVREIKEHVGPVLALAASPDGRTLWSGGFDRRLREWDAESMTLRRVVAVHAQSIADIAVSRDGRLVATACADRLVRVFDVAAHPSGEVVPVECAGHAKEATAVAFTADGRHVYSGAKDETIRGFDAASGAQIAATPETTGQVHALALSGNGATLWSASESWTKTPVWKRYFRWLGKTATLDFGTSFTDDRLVIDKIAEALPITLGLNFVSIVLIYLIAIPIGVRAAVRRGSVFDGVSSVILFALAAMPSFWVGTLLITGFSSKRNWNVLPSIGLHALDAESMSYLTWLRDFGSHLVLPLIVLTYAGFAGLSRYMRTSMLETIAQDYVRTARAKGLSERAVVYKHALRNSLITIVTLVGTMLPAMIGGSVIVEWIFTIQGMGWLGFQAISERDYPVVMAITTFTAVLTLFGMLVSDVLYTVVDPRISHA